jgi:hypothetical protein
MMFKTTPGAWPRKNLLEKSLFGIVSECSWCKPDYTLVQCEQAFLIDIGKVKNWKPKFFLISENSFCLDVFRMTTKMEVGLI